MVESEIETMSRKREREEEHREMCVSTWWYAFSRSQKQLLETTLLLLSLCYKES